MSDPRHGQHNARTKQKQAMKQRSKCVRTVRKKGKECKAEFIATKQIEVEEKESKKQMIMVQKRAAKQAGIKWVDPEAENKKKQEARRAAAIAAEKKQ